MKYLFIVLTLLTICIGGIGAQTLPEEGGIAIQTGAPSFSFGDQYFGIAAGGYFPFLLIDPNTGSQGDPNQNIGGNISLQWNIYLNSFFSIGAETAYIFSNTPNSQLLSLWPIAIQIGFAPRVGQFLIPVHIDVGVIFSYYENSTKIDLLVRGGVGFYWFFNPSWGVGIDADYYFVPQIYLGPSPSSADNRLLNSVTASVGVVYRL